MSTFLDSLATETNLTHTENGAVTNKSSLNAVVDFFGLAGAMRNNPEGAADLFEKAFAEDPQTAARVLFYLRDVRGGQGERDVFRAGLQRWAERPANRLDEAEDIARFKDILRLVPEYGRWDDLLAIGLGPSVVDIIRDQLKVDLLNYAASPVEQVSLLAKWLPSENASSAATKRLARELATALGQTPAQYRRTLSKLRGRIRLLEQDMSRRNWNEIDYGKLPSQAHRRHVKAFERHTPERYQAYLDSVTKGEAKINVSTVYPYEIYDMVQKGQEDYANVAWEALPDYTEGKSAIVMADVSASMVRPYQSNNPIAVAVSLALYFAERNQGAFHGHFMTFSANPQLVKVTGDTLRARIRNIERAEWNQNTDLLKAFRAILAAAKKSGAGDVPEVLYVISDMEFDQARPRYAGGHYERQIGQDVFGGLVYQNIWVPDVQTSDDIIFAVAQREFEDAGFQLPHVVFWNVDARNMQTPATIHDGHVTLVSGCSPTVFGMAVQGKTPLELVESVVNSERYARIVL